MKEETAVVEEEKNIMRRDKEDIYVHMVIYDLKDV